MTGVATSRLTMRKYARIVGSMPLQIAGVQRDGEHHHLHHPESRDREALQHGAALVLDRSRRRPRGRGCGR